jgi:outer membrane protein
VTIMKRQLFTFSFLCLLALGTRAQDTLTLEDCLKIGIENNLSLQSKRKEIQKGKYGISENRAKLLPQINGFANYNDNIPSPLPTAQRTAIPTM